MCPAMCHPSPYREQVQHLELSSSSLMLSSLSTVPVCSERVLCVAKLGSRLRACGAKAEVIVPPVATSMGCGAWVSVV